MTRADRDDAKVAAEINQVGSMGDIYVHVRMKECCRKVLKDLDKRKARAKLKTGLLGTPSLFQALGEKTIDDAKAVIGGDGASAAGGAGSELERLTRAACEKVCTRHAGEHDGKGETEEGAFWWMMAAAVAGQQVSQVAGQAEG
jgi:hypothetical protein